jgi:hypothetical protein
MAEADQAATSLATETPGTAGKPAPENQATSQTTGMVLDLASMEEKDRARLAKFKTGNDLAKSYLHLESKLGAAVTLPGKDATAEERDAFYTRLGRPESKDGYELDTLFLADGITKDSETENRIRDIAFDLGLNKDNARRLHKTFIDLANRGAAMVKDMKEKARDTLRKEWSGEYDKNISLIGSVLRKYGDAQTIQYMNSGPGNDPVMLRLLAKFGKTISPDTLETGSIPSAAEEQDDGARLFPNSPQMTGANRRVSIRQGQ